MSHPPPNPESTAIITISVITGSAAGWIAQSAAFEIGCQLPCVQEVITGVTASWILAMLGHLVDRGDD